jgi:peptide-methionine (S)-S-oxide reductase
MKLLRSAVPVALVALLATFFIPSPDAGRVIAASDAPVGKTETAVLAGGCFWGMESVFEHVRGVTNVVSGFSGGSKETAHYDDVSEGDTGHAESVQITFDPARISYATLLDVYFRVALRGFYPAEAYHQQFAALHPLYPYIVINDAPKLVQLRERFPKLAD